MSDLLSGLLDELLLPTEPFGDGYDEIHNVRQESNHERNVQTRLVIDRVWEALRNPTDEQVRVIAWRTQQQQGWNGTLEQRVRAVLAAAGGDDE